MKIAFRAITKDDLDFLWRLHVESLKEYVEKTWGWDEALQRTFVREIAEAGAGTIVTVDGSDAGVWHVIERDHETFLNSVRLLPEFQNRGIGTRLISGLIDTGKPVRLQVLKVNPAISLYRRLGFEVTDETGTHFKMVRS